MSEAKSVYQCIAQVQAAIAKEGIAKDRRNQSQGYSFRGIDDVYNALCGLMADAGLVILPRTVRHKQVERSTKSGSALFYTVVTVEYDFVSAHDGSRHTARFVGEAMDSADKSTNKALSAAYKYACMQVFCIPTEGGSVDSENDHYDVAREAAAKQVAERKLAEFRKTEKPSDPPKPQAVKPASTSKNFDMLGAFREIKTKIGEANYYRILGANGYEKSNQITDVNKARAIYREMGECLKAMNMEADAKEDQ